MMNQCSALRLCAEDQIVSRPGRLAPFILLLIFLVAPRATLAQASWQEEFAKMPLGQSVGELDRSNCVQVMLHSFRRNAAVKALIFMPGATDEFYFFHRAHAVLTNASPTLLDAVIGLTNQTYIRASVRPPFLLMHTAEDPLEPLIAIEDPPTVERIQKKKFQKAALFYDKDWDYVEPLLAFYANVWIRPGRYTAETYHFFRHSFAAFDLTAWEAIEAASLADKTTFTVKKRKLIFQGDTRTMAPTPVPDDFLIHRR
jgi:hypothetical protein